MPLPKKEQSNSFEDIKSLQNEEDIVEADITVRTESDCPSFIKLCILLRKVSQYVHFFIIWVESSLFLSLLKQT
jgi:hypothetical protein